MSKNKVPASMMGMWVGIGVAIGVSLHHIALGAAIGVALGGIFAALARHRLKNNDAAGPQ